MAYQSKHTGTAIDNAVTEHSIIDINSQISQLNTLINNLNTSISNLQNKDISLESSINNLNTKIDNIDFQEPWTGSAVLQSGKFGPSQTITYTATQNCIIYITFWLQANQSGNLQIQINGVNIINLTTGEAIASHLNTVPIFLQKGDKILFYQNSNETGEYCILSVK